MALLGWWFAWTRTRRGNTKRLKRAFQGEDDADALLREHGFVVLDEQVTTRFLMTIDDEAIEVLNRCDRIVERDGLVYVADVKTGDRARDPTHPATRRQLLEYLLVHEADGALLVDMEDRQVLEVAFPGLLDPP